MPANNADFHGLTFSHEIPNEDMTYINAHHPEHGTVGWMEIMYDGTIGSVYVHDAHRRKGIATGMFNYAKQLGFNPSHSEHRTPDGDAWARNVGGELPEYDGPDPDMKNRR